MTCALHRAKEGIYLLTVKMGENEIVSERFKQEPDALAHATFLIDDFVSSGWTEVYCRDPRI